MCCKNRSLGRIRLQMEVSLQGFEMIFGLFKGFVQPDIFLVGIFRLFLKLKRLFFDPDSSTDSYAGGGRNT